MLTSSNSEWPWGEACARSKGEGRCFVSGKGQARTQDASTFYKKEGIKTKTAKGCVVISGLKLEDPPQAT